MTRESEGNVKRKPFVKAISLIKSERLLFFPSADPKAFNGFSQDKSSRNGYRQPSSIDEKLILDLCHDFQAKASDSKWLKQTDYKGSGVRWPEKKKIKFSYFSKKREKFLTRWFPLESSKNNMATPK